MICGVIGMILGIGVLILNLYWYYKILKKLVRMIKGEDHDGYRKTEDEEELDENGEPKKKGFNLERT